ncbi:MAG: hypothetical protein ACE5HD_09600 [Acidobacteriota bacterium]
MDETPGHSTQTAAVRPPENQTAVEASRPARLASRWRLSGLRLEWPAWALRMIRPRPPGLAIMFSRDRFILAEMQPGRGAAGPVLSHLTSHELPEGSLTPGLTEPNLAAPVEVASRVGRALDALPQRSKMTRISVVIPDGCARVTLLTLREIPRSQRQASQMIRWQIRKRVPFPLDAARLTMQRFPLPDGSERVMVVLALDTILAQYEQIMTSLGLQAGLIDLSTFNLANFCLANPAADHADLKGDLAVLNVTEEEFSLLVMRDTVPLFYRSRPLLHGKHHAPEQTRRELQRELVTSSTYYRERLSSGGAGIRKAYLRVAQGSSFSLNGLAAEIFGVTPTRTNRCDWVALAPDLPGETPALLEEAAPAMGIVVGRWIS